MRIFIVARWQGRCIPYGRIRIMKDVMRRLFLIPVMVGILVSGAAQAFAQSATVMPKQPSITNPDQKPERRSTAPPNARSVVVPSNVVWTNTGITVRRGQYLRFEPSGEIRLSFNGDDVAYASGAMSLRHNDKAPIPTIPAGALIGRVGNGQPFSIGDTAKALDMPDGGRLSLGVNDDHVHDNSGNFVVKIWEP